MAEALRQRSVKLIGTHTTYKISKFLGAGKTHGPLFCLGKAEQHSKLGALMAICYSLLCTDLSCVVSHPPSINL